MALLFKLEKCTQELVGPGVAPVAFRAQELTDGDGLPMIRRHLQHDHGDSLHGNLA